MNTPDLPPTDPRFGEAARARMALTIACIFIGVTAVIAVVALRHYPLPLRVFIVAGDLIAVAALWLVVRQKFSGK